MWFKQYEDDIWHKVKDIEGTHCRKCREPEKIGLCGISPDWPTWTGCPQVSHRCVECVSQLVRTYQESNQ